MQEFERSLGLGAALPSLGPLNLAAIEGLVRRVRGSGSQKGDAQAIETNDRLVRAAASMIRDGQVIALDLGTSALPLVQHLPEAARLTVVTRDFTVAEYSFRHNLRLVLLGGEVRRDSMTSLSRQNYGLLDSMHIDVFFVLSAGIHPEGGVSARTLQSAEMKRGFSARADKTVLLAPPERLNQELGYPVISATDLDVMIVDISTSMPVIEEYKAKGIEVIVAA